MDWLAYRLSQLSGRERGLLLALVCAALPLALGFLLVAPVLEAREAARRSVVEANALRGWVAARVVELPPGGLSATPDPERLPERAPIGLSGLEQSLVRAGLRDRVTQLANRADGGVDLEFDPVAFDALIGWLFETTPEWGYAIAAFRIERDDPGLATGIHAGARAMIRALFLALVFVLGLVAAAVWYGQMSHLRRIAGPELPGWMQDIAPEAGLRQGRIEWAAHGIVPDLTLQWTARAPTLAGWHWDLRMAGAGIDLAGTASAPFWPGSARVRITGGQLDLSRLIAGGSALAGMAAIETGELLVENLTGVPRAAGNLAGRVASIAVVDADFGAGVLAATLALDGAWTFEAQVSGGVAEATVAATGNWPETGCWFELKVAETSALPGGLRDLLAGAGQPDGSGWVVEGTMQAF